MISVDTKKKELVGNYNNGGREWQPKGEPEQVNVHDFIDPAVGKAIPYGVYDIGADEGWVSVGADHDTAAFAVRSRSRRWWAAMGRRAYPRAATADQRRRRRLQRLPEPAVEGRAGRFADDSGLTSPCATSRRAPASGTRSSTACSPTSR